MTGKPVLHTAIASVAFFSDTDLTKTNIDLPHATVYHDRSGKEHRPGYVQIGVYDSYHSHIVVCTDKASGLVTIDARLFGTEKQAVLQRRANGLVADLKRDWEK